MPRLLVIKGADEGKQFDLNDATVSVGRDSSNDIRLHDTEVSRRHVEFRQEGGSYSVSDLGSANGTFINGEPVEKAILQTGDHIHIGQTILVFSSGHVEADDQATDLAEKISMISRNEAELSSAIIKTIAESEGSQILTHPDNRSPWLKTALANLSIMYEASQAVSHILDLNELLSRILELIFRSIAAHRGVVMLKNEDTGELEPKAVRWRKKNETHEKMSVSRTIMDYVLREKQGILVADAAKDERFNTGQSIVRFGIREVICVPMKGRHETLGVLYLDTQSDPQEIIAGRGTSLGKFKEDHLSLAIAVAHQAALAVEETRYHKAMLQAERLAAIGQTIAALSHHIKNILQGLRSGSELLQMGLNDKNEKLIQQGWRIAEKNQGKIYNLVMDMLSYSKAREPAVEPCDLNQIVRDVFELLEARAKEKNVKLEVSYGSNLPVVHVDPDGIHRALLNVVVNAIDAAEGRDNPKVTIGSRYAEDEWVRLLVLDNGPGIPANQIDNIFKPFVSSKGERGTGLGLAVSRKILREHGGDILVQSQIDAGSKFALRLPMKSPVGMDPAATTRDMPLFPPENE